MKLGVVVVAYTLIKFCHVNVDSTISPSSNWRIYADNQAVCYNHNLTNQIFAIKLTPYGLFCYKTIVEKVLFQTS